MITQTEWIEILVKLASDMRKKGTVYGWRSPVNEYNSLKQSSCVSYVGLALQRAKLLPKNTYINFQYTGRIHGPGAGYIKKHDDYFTIKYPRKSPQALKSYLQPGDICGYKTHVMVFAGWKGTVPLWYSLERSSSSGYGKKPRIDVKEAFSYYNKRTIDAIIRIKFKEEEKKIKSETKEKKKKTNSQKVVQHTTSCGKYRFKRKMNLRKEPSAKSQKMGTIPKNKIKTAWDKEGNWIEVKVNGKYYWVNASKKYATKLN